MIILGVLLALAAPSRAQIAPAPSAPVTAENLDEVFRRFASDRPMLPTLKEVQADQLKRDLAPRPGERPAATGPARADLTVHGQPPLPGVRRESMDSVDVAVSRPLRRVELGIGASERNLYVGNLHLENDTSKYAFISLDLSKNPLAKKLFHSPTAVHTEAETGDRIRVAKGEYSVSSLTKP